MTHRFSPVALAFAAAATLGAQSPGRSTLSGVVIDSESSQPIRQAFVTLTGSGVAGRAAFTDDAGRFHFVSLPSTTVIVSASKPAYLPSEYGAKGAGRPGIPVRVRSDDSIGDLSLRLYKGGVLSGTILAHLGGPASGVQVLILRHNPEERVGSRVVQTLLADDLGQYRAYGLPPGTYVVAASRWPAISTGLLVRSTAEVDRAFREQEALMANVAAGGVLPSQGRSPGAPSSADRPHADVPIYFPGTPFFADAQVIAVTEASEQGDLDFTLQPMPAGEISGLVGGDEGTDVSVSLNYDGPQIPGIAASVQARRLPAHGTREFRFSNVPPGRYKIAAQSVSPAETPSTPMWASMDIEVNGPGPVVVALQLRPSLTLAGRVTVEATSEPRAIDLATLKVRLTPLSSSDTPIVGPRFGPGGRATGPTTPVQPDGTFAFRGLLPGRYAIEVVGAGPEWWLRSVQLQGRDVLDNALELAAEPVSAAAVILSDRHTVLSGQLLTEDSQPAVDYYVVVFPVDPGLRPSARRVVFRRPASDGSFFVSDLPAGDYFVAVLFDLPSGQWRDPRFLDDVAGSGIKVSIALGQHVVQNLRLGGR